MPNNMQNNESAAKTIVLGMSLEDNVRQFEQVFQGDDTLRKKYFSNQEHPQAKFCILYIAGMINPDAINRNIIQPIIQSTLPKNYEGSMDVISNQVVLSHHAEKSFDGERITEGILRGGSALFMDNCDAALVINTKGFKSRSISEPEGEKILKGPREGFVEPILVNLSMIRRKLTTPDLKFKFLTLGVKSQTKVSVCYIDGIVNHQILSELMERIHKINIDNIAGSEYITELIRDSPYSPFKTIGNTERPDVAASELLEGRIVVVVDGTPVVLTLPFLFEEYFQTDDDYYINYYFASVSRILRMLSFLITVTFPGLYVAVLAFHQEMIPTPLLMSISAAREGIPFPTIIETLALLLAFEILREAGIRMPISIGQSLSILGALVLGTAAVEARIVSASVIIIIALSGLTGLMTPKIKGPIILIRLILVLLSGALGLYGFLFGIIGLTIHLCSIRSFGVPYIMNFTSLEPEDLKDAAVRVPIWFLKERPKFISGRNKVRQTNRSKS